MKDKLLWIFSALSFAITMVSMRFLPEEVPMHYDFRGNIDRYGSKYELFIFPVIMLFFTLFFLGFISYHKKQLITTKSYEKDHEELRFNIKVLRISAVAVLLLFVAIHCGSIYKAYQNAEAGPEGTIADIYPFLCVAIGLMMIVLGNIMPKAKRNGLFGLRTGWSMANDQTWLASNRFGGSAIVLAGIGTVICAFIFEGMTTLYITMGLLMLAAIASVIYSYVAYKRYAEEPTEEESVQ